MKVGTVCYATDSGLGVLAKSFFDNGVVTDPVVIRHGKHPTHDDWYPGAYQVTDLKNPGQLRDVRNRLAACDAVLFFETPFDWSLFARLRAKGVRTYLMTMYECTPRDLPGRPDVFLCPSLLDLECFASGSGGSLRPFETAAGEGGSPAYYTPVPVAVPWRLRTRAEVFVHNAGHGGLKGRNGTLEFLRAIPMVKSPARFVIRYQEQPKSPYGSPLDELPVLIMKDERVSGYHGTLPRESLYADGDVFVFPEKFNGLSLPLQEAFGSGMAVMATDRFPNNTYLPRDPLIPVANSRRNRIGPPYREFDEAVVEPKNIAAWIDHWCGKDITALSEAGRRYADENSWAVLGPKYKALLEAGR